MSFDNGLPKKQLDEAWQRRLLGLSRFCFRRGKATKGRFSFPRLLKRFRFGREARREGRVAISPWRHVALGLFRPGAISPWGHFTRGHFALGPFRSGFANLALRISCSFLTVGSGVLE